MGRSNESQERIKVVSAQLIKETKEHELKTNSEKATQNRIPEYGDIILGGEISIPLGIYRASRAENGKMVNVEFLGKATKSENVETVEER